MHKGPGETREFFAAFEPPAGVEVVICPPFGSLGAAVASGRTIFAQNVHWEDEGAFTGEVSTRILLELGVQGAIVGHSERRQYFGETDDTVNRKLKAALAAGLTPIVCVGEVLQERESGLTEDVLRRQCQRGLSGVSGEEARQLVIAYEPVWAIGTGKTATPQIAAEAHVVIRAEAAKSLGKGVGESMRILYGGSVKPENAKALMSENGIDGALVGGASLDPKSFTAIVKY